MAEIDVRMTCIACPVQIEGSIDGVPIYFRARGAGETFGSWRSLSCIRTALGGR